MAIGDLVEATDFWPVERVESLDYLFDQEGLPTLTEIRLSFSKTIRRVLRRGRIKNEVEYYAVRNAVELSEDEQALWKLLKDYEEKAES